MPLLLGLLMQDGWTQLPEGRLALPSFTSAPYPHASREQGYKNYPRDPHYTDSTVGVFVPSGFKPGKTVDFVVHFHGHNNHVSQVFTQFGLARQMQLSGLNAVLLVPQGPRDAADSGCGKLELSPTGLSDLLQEALKFLSLPGKVGRVILTAHSGGYKVTSAILARHEKVNVTDVLLFDATYGGLPAFADWAAGSGSRRLVSICTDHLGHENAQLVALLQKKGQQPRVMLEEDVQPSDLRRRGSLFVLTTTLEHNEVVSKRDYFGRWLATSNP